MCPWRAESSVSIMEGEEQHCMEDRKKERYLDKTLHTARSVDV